MLHQRPYRETSLLLDVLTLDYGRISLVARGMRQKKRRNQQAIQLFQPFWLNWFGRGELLTLGKIAGIQGPYLPKGHSTLGGLYINELLVRLLSQQQAEPMIFEAYQQALSGLQAAEQTEQTLRIFEKRLLESLGYGVDLTTDHEGQTVMPERHYGYLAEAGLRQCAEQDPARLISGASLKQLHDETLHDPVSLNEAKQLMRVIINYHLEGKPLKSRQLFAEMQRYAGPKTEN